METTQQTESKIIELKPFADEMVVNMGPQHPSTHGVLRLELKLDGEVVREAIPHIGYLHRCFEKHSENLSYPQIIPFTDRMDYIAAMNQNWGFCLAVEKLLEADESRDFEIPERAEYLRVLICELNRIASHLLSFGTYGMDLGAFTPFLYAFRDRERLLLLFEKVCGARLTYNYVRIGGVSEIIPMEPGSIAEQNYLDEIEEFLDYFEPKIDEYNELLTKNSIFSERTTGVAVMSEEMVLSYGATGPNLRGSGVDWDLRRDEPYSIYDRFDFDVPVAVDVPELGAVVGDCWCRYKIRMDEMKESVRIVRQILAEGLPDGPVMADLKAVRPPKGEIYFRSEAPRGELGFYIVSDGTPKPVRVKGRSPCFSALSVMQELSRGLMVADIIAIIGSIDIVMGEVDR
ncbi:NADH-quinone oxidoreductase subunit NuoD [Candidatus Poribacteria bacterium]|nr:MAG: NADH-quinone oxidoreductase subunit NuoD [Candidatus Poribacteria bacterium]